MHYWIHTEFLGNNIIDLNAIVMWIRAKYNATEWFFQLILSFSLVEYETGKYCKDIFIKDIYFWYVSVHFEFEAVVKTLMAVDKCKRIE